MDRATIGPSEGLTLTTERRGAGGRMPRHGSEILLWCALPWPGSKCPLSHREGMLGSLAPPWHTHSAGIGNTATPSDPSDG